MRENENFSELHSNEFAIQIPDDAKTGDQLVLDPTAEFKHSMMIGYKLVLTFRHPGAPVTPRNPVPTDANT